MHIAISCHISLSLALKHFNPYPSLIIQALDKVYLFLVGIVVFSLINLVNSSNTKSNSSNSISMKLMLENKKFWTSSIELNCSISE